MRVYIVGGPGSGKSSLADALAMRSDLTAVHLDDHWDRTFATDERGIPTAAALAYRAQLTDDLLRRADWIVEGAEPPLLTALAEASEAVVWCDVPFRVAAARMVRRHVKADLSRSNAFPGYRRLWRFLSSVRRRYDAPAEPTAQEWTKWTRAHLARGIEPYEGKVIRSRGGASERTVRATLEAVKRS